MDGPGHSAEATAPHPPSSRILLISPNGDVSARSLCQLASSITGEPLSDDIANGSDPDDETQRPQTIPWTIDNRYYTANVHFRAVSLDGGVLGASVPNRRHATNTDSARTASNLQLLAEELKEVQAVVIVTTTQEAGANGSPSRPRSLEQHRALLDCLNAAANQGQDTSTSPDGDDDEDGASMPLGFGLSVSTVVALPSVVASTSQLSPTCRPSAAEQAPKKEDLDSLYAENGWEYIDLGKILGLDADMDGTMDDGLSDTEDDAEEEDGLARIREALEANLWPDLVRKRTPAQSGHSRLAEEQSPSAFQPASLSQTDTASPRKAENADADADADAEIEAMFRKLDLNLPSNVAVASDQQGSSHFPTETELDPEPTPQDEELARKFLASIAAFESTAGAGQGRGNDDADANAIDGVSKSTDPTLPETDEERKRNQAAALRRLEDFLRSEDPDWPGMGPETGVGGAVESTSSSSNTGKEAAAADLGFDDDFADFVSPPAGQDGHAPTAAGWLPPDEEEVLASSVFKKKLDDTKSAPTQKNADAGPSSSSNAGDQTEADAAKSGDNLEADSSLSPSEKQSRALVEQIFARQQGVDDGDGGELASTLEALRDGSHGGDSLEFDFDLTSGDFNRSTFQNLNDHIDDLEAIPSARRGAQQQVGSDLDLDFPRMLSTIQREAERVRGIAGREEREREAARVVAEVIGNDRTE